MKHSTSRKEGRHTTAWFAGGRVRRVAIGAATILAAGLAGGVARAQETPAPPMERPPAGAVTVPTTVTAIPEAPELVIEDGKVQLQLEDAILIALRRNLDLAVERYSHEQSLLGIIGNQGIYDLRSTADVTVSQSDSPSVSQVAGVPVISSDNRDADFSLAQLTPFGGEAGYNLNLSRSSTNNQDQLVNPSYFAQSGFRFTQPLLRDFGRLVTERPIIIARLDSGISRELFEQRVSQVLLDVENAYWNLVEANEQLVVAQESLALARELHERNRIQVDVGTLAPIELVQSEATIAEREEGIISSQAAAADAADRLLELLNLPGAMSRDLSVEPITPPETERLDVNVEQAIQTALDERPELRSKQIELQRLEVDSKFFRNQKLPTTDLVLSYGAAGIAGHGEIPQADGTVRLLDTSLTDALADVRGRDFDGWTIGVTFAVPIQNRTARAQSTIADLDLEQGRVEMQQLELSVVTDVRAAARGVRTAAQQIESARASRVLQERNLDAERKRYENGMSDSFRITQIQNDLTQARSREVSSVANYRRALTAYYLAIGRLLEQDGVALEGPVEVRLPGRTFSLFR